MSQKEYDSKQKKDGAMRLFGALSGIDEEYLAACEEEQTSGSKVVVFMNKYGKGLAAVLCLAVLGAAYLGLSQTVRYKNSDTTAAPQNFMAATDGVADNMENAEADEQRQENMPEMESETNEGVTIMKEQGAFDTDSLSDDLAAAESTIPQTSGSTIPQTSGSTNPQNSGSGAEQSKMETLSSELCGLPLAQMQELTLEEAGRLPVIGEYVPKEWPADGALAGVYYGQNNENDFVRLEWTYGSGEDSFSLIVTDLGEECPDWVKAEMSQNICVPAEEFTREYVAEQIKAPLHDSGDTTTPRGQLEIIYEEDGHFVRVYFSGHGSVDEIWEMLAR